MCLSNEVTAALAGAVVGAVSGACISQIMDFLNERKQQNERLADFKLELIRNYHTSDYNGLHATIEPDLPMVMLKSETLEELLKKNWFPKSWNREVRKEINLILKSIEDINRAIKYREGTRVVKNESLFKRQNEVIRDESEDLSFYINRLSNENLDGLGKFLGE